MWMFLFRDAAPDHDLTQQHFTPTGNTGTTDEKHSSVTTRDHSAPDASSAGNAPADSSVANAGHAPTNSLPDPTSGNSTGQHSSSSKDHFTPHTHAHSTASNPVYNSEPTHNEAPEMKDSGDGLPDVSGTSVTVSASGTDKGSDATSNGGAKNPTAPSLTDTAGKKQEDAERTAHAPVPVDDTVRKDSANTPPGKDSVLVNAPKKDSLLSQQPLPDSTKTIRVPSPPPTQEPFRRFYAAGFWGPAQNHQRPLDAPRVQVADPNLYAADSEYIAGNTWMAGARFGMYLSKRFALDLQVHYSDFSQTSNEILFKYYHLVPHVFQVSTTFGSFRLPVDSCFNYQDNSGPPSDTFRIRAHIIENYRFLHMPVSARFNAINSKYVKLYVRGGFAASYVLSQHLELVVPKTQKRIVYDQVAGLSKLNLSFLFGIGLEARLYKNVGVWAEPGVSYMANSISRGGAFTNHPYAFHMPAGLIWHF
jgi:hypothetical protein